MPGFEPGACFAGGDAVPIVGLFLGLRLFAGMLWPGRAGRGRAGGCCFS